MFSCFLACAVAVGAALVFVSVVLPFVLPPAPQAVKLIARKLAATMLSALYLVTNVNPPRLVGCS